MTAKGDAFEDCLVALKKAYEKDQMNLQDFLKVIISDICKFYNIEH